MFYQVGTKASREKQAGDHFGPHCILASAFQVVDVDYNIFGSCTCEIIKLGYGDDEYKICVLYSHEDRSFFVCWVLDFSPIASAKNNTSEDAFCARVVQHIKCLLFLPLLSVHPSHETVSS